MIDPVNISGSDQQLHRGVGSYHGFTLKETSAGAAAKVVVYDGTDTSGPILEVVNLLADESAREFYEIGVVYSRGVYVEIVTGDVEGSLRLMRG